MNKRFGNKRDFEFFGCERYELRLGFFRSSDGGQLGNGSTINTDLPVKVAGNVGAVTAGFGHSLFVTADGTLWAMGLNNYGQLGNGATSNTNQPVVVTGNVVAVLAAGYEHSLFVTADGTLWTMGYNVVGELGDDRPAAPACRSV